MTKTTMPKIAKEYREARACSVPAIALSTADQFAALRTLLDHGNGKDYPLVQWDVARGYTDLNEPGREAISRMVGGMDPTIGNPAAAVGVLPQMPENGVAFLFLMHRFLEDPVCIQGVLNLIDDYAATHRTLVMLGGNHFRLPVELTNHVHTIREALPDEEQIRTIVSQVAEDAGASIDDTTTTQLADAVIGLPVFAAEQALSLGFDLESNTFHRDAVWQRKFAAIEQCKSLSVMRSTERFDDIGGCSQIKRYSQMRIAGPERPRVVVLIDEIDKQLAGAAGGVNDGGVSKDQHGVLLTAMQDRNWSGMLFYGPPGAAKSAISKALGNEAGGMTLSLDLGGAKEGIVGSSEANIRHAVDVIEAVAQGSAIFVATCNSVGALSPELQRRFSDGKWYFDLPTEEERDLIWPIWITKCGLPMAETLSRPNDEGWTGAEIRTCCVMARRLSCSLKEAAAFITPVCRSNPEVVESLRKHATGRFLSASYPGEYRGPENELAENKPSPASRPRRRLRVES
jgi:hypothetical protein